MTRHIDCPPAPGPLEEYATRFDDLFTHAAHRCGFRACLAGLLLPRDRTKTLTGLAGAAPIVEAQEPPRPVPTVLPLRVSMGRRGRQRPPPGVDLSRHPDRFA